MFRCLWYVLFIYLWLHGLQDLSSLTRDWTRVLSMKVRNPHHWTGREFPVFCASSSLSPILPFIPSSYLLMTTSLFSVICESIFCYIHLFYFSDSTCKWKRSVCLSVWFISQSIISSMSIHIVANGKISVSCGWIIFQCVFV